MRDEHQSRSWADKLVATLEDENGSPVELSSGMDFEASSSPMEGHVECVG